MKSFSVGSFFLKNLTNRQDSDYQTGSEEVTVTSSVERVDVGQADELKKALLNAHQLNFDCTSSSESTNNENLISS